MPYCTRDPKGDHNFDNPPYWGCIGIMEKKMETIIYSSILELYGDSRKEHGNYYIITGYI